MPDEPPNKPPIEEQSKQTAVAIVKEEPKETGVEAKQGRAEGEFQLLPPDNKKAYSASMSETLEGYVVSGIVRDAVPFLMTHEKYAEDRFKSVDTERKQVLRDLKDKSDECHRKDVLVTKYSERLKNGKRGSLVREVLITIGAAILGAGITQQMSEAKNGLTLLALGTVLLLIGWGSAIADHVRTKNVLK